MKLPILIFIVSTTIARSTQIDTNLYASDSSCVCDYKPNVDYFPDKIDTEHAVHYSVRYFDSYKVVNTSTSTYVLYQCGTPVPNLNTTHPNAIYVSIPLKRAFVGSTTMIPWLEFIGERRSIVAVNGGNSISSPCLRKRLEDGDDLTDVYDPSTYSVNTTLLEELDVDVAFCSAGWGCPLATNNVISIPVSAQQENSVLAEAEYVEFISLFYNREKASTDVVRNIDDRFSCAAAFVPSSPRPKVLWASYYNGWSVPSCPNYYCELIDAAGGDLITNFPPGSLTWGYLTDDEFLSAARDADVLIYTGFNYWSADAYGTPAIRVGMSNKSDVLDQINAVQNERVYDTLGNGEKDWFESRIAEPDIVLQDLISILHPTALGNTHNRVWLRQIEPQPGIAPIVDDSCLDVSAPLELKATGPCESLTPISGVERVSLAMDTSSSTVMCDPVTGAPVFCQENCVTCDGPDASDCLSCVSGFELTRGGTCDPVLNSSSSSSMNTETVVVIVGAVCTVVIVLGIALYYNVFTARRSSGDVPVTVSAVVVLPTIEKM